MANPKMNKAFTVSSITKMYVQMDDDTHDAIASPIKKPAKKAERNDPATAAPKAKAPVHGPKKHTPQPVLCSPKDD